MNKVSTIIINFNTPEMTARAIIAARQNNPKLNWEFIVIDNGLEKKMPIESINSFADIYLKNGANLGFARAVNQGVARASGDYLLLLNSDVLVEPEAISKLAVYLKDHPKTGAVAPQMIYPGGKLQYSFGRFPTVVSEFLRLFLLARILPGATVTYRNFFTRQKFLTTHPADWLSGGCILIRREAYEQAGGFDDNYFFGVEDFDFCWQLKKHGWEVIYHPAARVMHFHGFSSGGTRTKARIDLGRQGVNYFRQKNFPRRRLDNSLINYLHQAHAIILALLKKI
jgi:GT2 family glycosyltransferase